MKHQLRMRTRPRGMVTARTSRTLAIPSSHAGAITVVGLVRVRSVSATLMALATAAIRSAWCFVHKGDGAKNGQKCEYQNRGWNRG